MRGERPALGSEHAIRWWRRDMSPALGVERLRRGSLGDRTALRPDPGTIVSAFVGLELFAWVSRLASYTQGGFSYPLCRRRRELAHKMRDHVGAQQQSDRNQLADQA
mgnify:CR=1 FL=1